MLDSLKRLRNHLQGARARKVALILMDVDGTLTDGTLYVLPDGQEIKGYHVQDGLGIFLAQLAGLKLGIITGKTSQALEIRAARLGLDELHQGIIDKKKVLLEIAERHQLRLEQVAFIGDDPGDLEVTRAVGFPAAVADAHPAIKKTARYLCRQPGGRGAVREVIEFILKAQGRWTSLRERASQIKSSSQNL
ncbi:MAG: HAD hydrolase family protein [Candidatus Saccharicenans sp.]|jgi:3-deoxy-D-manno-octulosonate 8-phosphate phosphatase (KDO 8-P phosphatase)|nr:HAD hydrolase family protein [Candidatus Saccharicenans sp.]MDH7492359.1 HAD hydrolase family protein [Candidatus Saccharicenans sp.]